MLTDHCKELGLDADPERWMELSWLPRLRGALGELEQVIPPGEEFILVDEDEWGTDEVVLGRRRIPFPERDGRYWGRPADDTEALAELEAAEAGGGGVHRLWMASLLVARLLFRPESLPALDPSLRHGERPGHQLRPECLRQTVLLWRAQNMIPARFDCLGHIL
jgi:hypothetical protein